MDEEETTVEVEKEAAEETGEAGIDVIESEPESEPEPEGDEDDATEPPAESEEADPDPEAVTITTDGSEAAESAAEDTRSEARRKIDRYRGRG